MAFFSPLTKPKGHEPDSILPDVELNVLFTLARQATRNREPHLTLSRSLLEDGAQLISDPISPHGAGVCITVSKYQGGGEVKLHDSWDDDQTSWISNKRPPRSAH